MRVTVVGAGYVGLVSAAGFAEVGNTVTCVDRSPERVDALQRGIIPIVEPGLDALVARNAADGAKREKTEVESITTYEAEFDAAIAPEELRFTPPLE